MNRIVIADICSLCDGDQSTGHYFAVAQNYVDMFDEVADVKVAGGPIYNRRFSANIILLPYNHDAGETKWLEKWHELMNCRALCKNIGNDDVLIMQSVALVTAIVGILLFLRKSCRLFFVQYNIDCINSPLKRMLWKMVSPKVHGVIGTLPSVVQAYGKPSIVIPDYIYTQKQPIRYLTYGERKYDVCMLGNIYRDKGTLEALQYLVGKGLKIIVAGKVGESDLEEQIKNVAQNDSDVDLRIGYLSVNEYHEILGDSKYCMLNYRGRYNEHTSGVVYDALFHKTPVLATDTASTKMVKEYGLGVAFDDISDMSYSNLKDIASYDTYQKNINIYLRQQTTVVEQLYDFLCHN